MEEADKLVFSQSDHFAVCIYQTVSVIDVNLDGRKGYAHCHWFIDRLPCGKVYVNL